MKKLTPYIAIISFIFITVSVIAGTVNPDSYTKVTVQNPSSSPVAVNVISGTPVPSNINYSGTTPSVKVMPQGTAIPVEVLANGTPVTTFGVSTTAVNNIEKINGTTVYNPSYITPVSGTDTPIWRFALWGLPDVMIYSITNTAQILTNYLVNGWGVNVTVTASGDQNVKLISTIGTTMVFGAGYSITITPTTGKSVIIDNLFISDLSAGTITMYKSITPVATFSNAGSYLMGFKAPVNTPVYFYSTLSPTPLSVGWIKNREE